MALEIAARYPDFAAGLVLLDSGVLFPSSAGTVFAEYLEGLRGPDFADQVEQIQFFARDRSVEITERYLWSRQRIVYAVNDKLGIEPDVAPVMPAQRQYRIESVK